MNYQIQSKIFITGIWTVKYKKWQGCYCTATKHTIQLTQIGVPATKDIIEAEKTLSVGG